MNKKRLLTGLASLGLIVVMAGLVFAAACAKTPAPTTPAKTTPAATPTSPATPSPTAKPTTPATTTPAATPTATPAQKITLAYSAHYPPDSIIANQLYIPFANELAKRSNGRLEIKFYWSGTLFKADTVMDALMTGKVDMGTASNVYLAGVEPLVLSSFVPNLFDDVPHLTRAWDAGLGSIVVGAFEKNNIMVPGNASVMNGYNYIFSNKSMPRTPADIKGLKMRSFNAMLDAFLIQAGASPTSMTVADVYLAMQRGTVDGYLTQFITVESSKLWEVTKYGFMVPVCVGAMNPFGVSRATWSKLPADLQKVIGDTAKEAAAKWNLQQMPVIEKDIIATAKAKGMQLAEPTPQELKGWRDLSQPVWDTFVKLAGQPGQQQIDIANKTRLAK